MRPFSPLYLLRLLPKTSPSHIMIVVRSNFGKKLVIIIGILMGGYLILQILLSFEDISAGLDRSRGAASPKTSNIRGQVDNRANLIDEQIAASLRRVSNMTFPDYLRVHALYDTSSKRALLELRKTIREKHISTPLFVNKLESESRTTPPKVCVSVATARRKGAPFSYLVQSISGLLNRMNYAKYKDEVYIHVFNVDNEPEKHKEVEWIRDLVPVTNLKVPIQPNGDFPIQTHYHENMDTAYIVREFYRLGCEYPILLEDDALATTNWVDSVMDMIEDLSNGRYSSVDWLGVRLFVARSYYPALQRRGINDFDPMFNMVAVMLNRRHMLAFADAMEEKVRVTMEARNHDLHLPKDLVMDQYKTNNRLKVLANEPVIFQHTGVYSSVSNRTVDESSVNTWIMFSKYFEAAGEPVRFQDSFWSNR